MSLTINTTAPEGARLVSVSGEVDVSNASELRDAIDAALSEGVSSVSVDISDVSYIDSTGIGVLVGAAHRAVDGGIAFSVANPQRNVARILSLLGMGEELNMCGGDQVIG